MNRILVFLALAVPLTLMGCGAKDEKAASSDGKSCEKKAAETKKAAEPAKKALVKVVVNAEIDAMVKAAAENCTVIENSGSVYSCKNNETSKFNDYVREKKPKDVYDSLAEIASGADKKLAATAVGLLNGSMSSFDRPLRKENATEAALQRVLALLEKADDSYAVILTEPATHIATLRGEHVALLKIVDAHKNDWVRIHAYTHLMTFGRMKVFDKEKEAAAKGPARLTVAALSAPRNMYDTTAEEKAVFCPWAKGYLADKDLKIVAEAAHTMNRCQGEYIDAFLDEAEKRLKNNEIKDLTLLFPMRDICFSMIKGVIDNQGVEKQCERNYALLEKIANDEAVPGPARGSALWNIYYQRRDKKSLDLMRKYENHKDPDVQKQAKDAIKSLVDSYKLK